VSGTLGWAIVCMMTALVSYTVAIWSERLGGRLRTWHAAVLWVGLATDLTGTGLMIRLAGGFHLSLHTTSGFVGLLLIALQTVWATRVVLAADELAHRRFHRYAVFVWLLWLVPFVSGVLLARGS